MTNDKNITLIESALWYAEELGFHVFPCWPESKKPATANGFKNATDDEETIRNWWEQHPNYNIGVWSGEKSGIFILDIDKKHDGLAALAKLENEYGKLPETWTVRTGGGGLQLYFRHPGVFVHKSEGAITKGIDVRGDDGYGMSPPSIHPDTGKPYKWVKHPLEVSLAEAPAWVLELNEKGLSEKKSKNKGSQKKRVPYGERDTFMTSEAGKLRAMGYEADRMERYLEETFNLRCDPYPVPKKNYFRDKARHAERSWDPNNNYHKTDLGNANRFRDMFREESKYCVPWNSWVVWDGMRWTKDKKLSVQELAKRSVEEIFQEGLKKKEKGLGKEAEEHIAWYFKSQDSARLSALLKQARSCLSTCPEEFDNDNWLLNVQNGTIDLKTGVLKEHDQEDLITKLAPVQYNPKAKCPTFMRFLNDVFLGRADLIEYVQKFFGYSLTGDVSERIFMIFQGGGRNGKSTLIGAIRDIMGDYAVTINPNVLMETKNSDGGAATPQIAKLQGSRLACASENEDNKRLAPALVKRLTGGEGDSIVARFLRADEFEFKATFKLLLGTNPLPKISANDQAAWDRIRRVPFDARFLKKGEAGVGIIEDLSFPEKLKNEHEGILAWCVQGCLLWQQEGLMAPDCVATSTANYRDSEDIIGRFIEECAVEEVDAEETRGLLYRSYTLWCGKNGHKSLSSTNFKNELERKGFEAPPRRKQGNIWKGIRLTEEASIEAKASNF